MSHDDLFCKFADDAWECTIYDNAKEQFTADKVRIRGANETMLQDKGEIWIDAEEIECDIETQRSPEGPITVADCDIRY